MAKTHLITKSSPLLHDANCVYCHIDLELNDKAVVCDSCNSPHHLDCWQENNDHCATFGCGEAADFTLTRDTVGAEPNDRRARREDPQVEAEEDTEWFDVAMGVVLWVVLIWLFFFSGTT